MLGKQLLLFLKHCLDVPVILDLDHRFVQVTHVRTAAKADHVSRGADLLALAFLLKLHSLLLVSTSINVAISVPVSLLDQKALHLVLDAVKDIYQSRWDPS